jgi:hypothetical protein
MSQQLDTQGEAHDALGSAVSSYGQRVLNDPHILGNLVTDLLPDLPRERNLLVMGAEAGVAAEISQHVEEQRIDPDTAVQLVARSLSERRSIDPAASMWVASEYAQAMGYRVRPQADAGLASPAPAPPPAPPMPAVPPTMTAVSGQPPVPTTPQSQEPQWPATPGSAPPQGPPPAAWPSWPNPTPNSNPQPGSSWPPAQQPGGYQAPGGGYPPAAGYQAPGAAFQSPGAGYQGPGGYQQPPAGGYQPPVGYRPSPGNGRKRGIIIGSSVLAVVVVFLIVAAVAHIAPFAKTAAAPTPTPTHPVTTPATHTHSATPTPTPTLAAGITPLLQLLPQDIADPTTQCSSDMKPGWKSPGLVSGLDCNDTDLPNGGYVDAYQLDSNADYNTTWKNFNTSFNFDESTAQSNCPPTGTGAQGITPWNSKAGFPSRQGQVLECWMGANAAPIYVWTLPTQDMFIVAVGADGSTFKALNTWWTSAESSPANAPTATPSPQAS